MASILYNSSFAQCGDNTFGPTIGGCEGGALRGNFDFTLLFEQSILSILPSALLLLLTPFRYLELKSQPKKVSKDKSYRLKLVAISVFAVLQLVSVILWATTSAAKTKASVAAATLTLVDALTLYGLSHAEHVRSIRPSSIISIYLFFTILFDSVQCRTLWLLPGSRAVAGLLTGSIAAKVVMLVLEGKEKANILMPQWAGAPPEAIGGVFNRSFFWWLNDLMARGWNGMLYIDNLYATDSALDSTELLAKLDAVWSQAKQHERHSLLKAVVNALMKPTLAPIIPRLVLGGFRFSQPFLLHSIVEFIGSDLREGDKELGYGLIGATGLIYIGLAVTTGIYQHKTNRFITACRGSLVALIFSKTLDLSATIAASEGSGALTHMSTDVDGICQSIGAIHDLWVSAIEVGVAIWLLERQIGLACVVPVAIAILCTLATMQVTNKTGPTRNIWNAAIQLRVSNTTAVLSHMKEVKLLGLSDRWLHDIQSLRERELEFSKASRKLIVAQNVISNLSFYLTPVGTFGCFILIAKYQTGQPFTVATAFTSLSILTLLSQPLAKTLSSAPSLAAGVASFDRIQNFLNSDTYPGIKNTLDNSPSFSGESDSPSISRIQHTDEIKLEDLPTIRPTLKEATDKVVLKLENAGFGLSLDDSPIIHDINITIRQSTMTIIIGKIGSGKSILLKGILGELQQTSGFVQRGFTIAGYCEQQPWLINDTIQNNIIGESSLEASWYKTVINACALDLDFEQFPRGDQSLIGSKGLTLSGGQKQRVALARAVYSRNQIMIIDDVLSGLDWATEEIVWKRVFGPQGLLLEQGVTVILATHAVRHIRSAYNVIVMGSDGTIVEQGNFSQLNRQDGYVQSLLVGEGKQDETTVNNDNSSDLKVIPTAALVDDDEAQDLLRAMGDTKLYKYYFKSIGWKYGLTLVFITCLWTLLEFFPQVILKWWSESESANPGAQTGMYFGIYAALGFGAVAAVGSNIWFHFVTVVPRSSQKLHWTLLKTVMSAPLSFFYTTDTGVTINRFSQDMSLIDRALPSALFQTIFGLMACFTSMILIVTSNKYLAAGLPFLIATVYVFQTFYLRTSRQMRHMDLEAKSPLYSNFMECISGISTIRAFGWTKAFQATNLRLLDRSQRPFYLMYCIQRWLNIVLDLFVAAIAVLVVTLAVQLKNSTSAGSVGIALLNVLTFSTVLTELIEAFTSLETSLGAIARLKNFETDTPQEIEPKNAEIPAQGWPARGSIHFKNVSASYAVDAEPILRNVSFSVQPGQKVAICGRTGSGKSSLILTLFRLLVPTSGTILVDSFLNTSMPLDYLRSHLLAIPQDPIFFPGSVRFNTCPSSFSTSPTSPRGDSAPTDSRIIVALKAVQLYDVLTANGDLDSPISSIPFSHGQKQLFCLARAILRKGDSKILVLDEAMANVDSDTDALMQEIIEREFEGYTVLAVVHKLDTVVGGAFDRVAVMDKGLLVEFGMPGELLEANGVFRGMWDSRN